MFSLSQFGDDRLGPDWEAQPPAPPLWPALGPERSTDHNTDRTKEAGCEGEEESKPVNAKRANRVPDGVSEEGVLVLRRFNRLPTPRVSR